MVEEDPPFFLVVLKAGSELNMAIPKLFGIAYGHLFSQTAVLRTKKAFQWDVTVERDEDRFYFADGWMEFLADNIVLHSENLVFSFAGNNVWKVKIYGVHGCSQERHVLPRFNNMHHTAETVGDPQRSLPPETSGRGSRRRVENGIQFDGRMFTKRIKHYHRNGMVVPIACAGKFGLVGETKVLLQYQNNRSVPVQLRWYPDNRHRNSGVLMLCNGWWEFVVDSGMATGTEYVFRFGKADRTFHVKPWKG